MKLSLVRYLVRLVLLLVSGKIWLYNLLEKVASGTFSLNLVYNIIIHLLSVILFLIITK